MARPRKISHTDAVELSMQVFWKKGFQGTSMRDIGQATSLNPGSLYGIYGNKRNLFFQVLEHYYQQLTQSVNYSINHSNSSKSLLHNFFTDIISIDKSRLRGCLLVNSLMELSDDAEMQSRVAAMFTGFEEMFYWVVVSGIKNKEFKISLDARSIAQFLVNNYIGIRIQSMTEQSQEQLNHVVENFLNVLED